MEVKAVVTSLHQTAYWISLEGLEAIDKNVYHMADVYRGAEFMLIMLWPPESVTEETVWLVNVFGLSVRPS